MDWFKHALRRRREFTLETFIGFVLIIKSVLLWNTPVSASLAWLNSAFGLQINNHSLAVMIFASGYYMAWVSEPPSVMFVALSLPSLILPFATFAYGVTVAYNPIPGYTMLAYWLGVMFAQIIFGRYRVWMRRSEMP